MPSMTIAFWGWDRPVGLEGPGVTSKPPAARGGGGGSGGAATTGFGGRTGAALAGEAGAGAGAVAGRGGAGARGIAVVPEGICIRLVRKNSIPFAPNLHLGATGGLRLFG